MQESLLTILRDEKTPVGQYRQAAHQLCDLIATQATSLVVQDPIEVKTPLATTHGKKVPHRVILIPILRAGMAMLPSFLNFFPSAPVGFFGIRRDESTALPQLYYENLPPLQPTDLVFILDPMVATAGSSLLAIQHLLKKGVEPAKIALASVLASTDGLQKIKTAYPYLHVITAAEDPSLNDRKFIVPGLGDFGDRYFGT